ncbi:hypothetical protein BGP79_11770 [Tersicoccus sp. Bi-70]|nr:hypothetical protein BGP79_11770 [Tersicoccus sp. Bi-70]
MQQADQSGDGRVPGVLVSVPRREDGRGVCPVCGEQKAIQTIADECEARHAAEAEQSNNENGTRGERA